ncbi:class I lanthipeptide [Fibrisoma limi]|nr:class I lanthipeptide [Fibrisoma limi]
MKKQIAKLSVKTDKIVSLSKQDAQQVIGALAPPATLFCPYIKTKIFC